jgi:uncharacterized protein involved in exopolysaccharide biosynthesis
MLVGIPLALGVLTVLVVFFLPRTYTAVVSFYPSSSQASLSQMAGLAAQFGVQLPGSGGASSPEFYSDLVRSTEFLKRVASASYTRTSDGDSLSGTFARIADIEKGTPARTLDATVRALRDDIVRVEPKLTTGVIRIRVQSEWPEISTQLAARLLAEIDDFNIRSHQAQAAADLRFAEERLEQSSAELQRAEDRMQSFLRRNREFRSDPQLLFEYERIQRDVTMRQNLAKS